MGCSPYVKKRKRVDIPTFSSHENNSMEPAKLKLTKPSRDEKAKLSTIIEVKSNQEHSQFL